MSSPATTQEPLISSDDPASASPPSSKFPPEIPELQEDHSLGHKKDPFTHAGIFNRLFFCWSSYILYLSRKIKLHPSNLGSLSPNFDANVFSNHLHHLWHDKAYSQIRSNALAKTLLRANVHIMILLIVLYGIVCASDYFQVLLIKEIIDYFEMKQDSSVTPLFGFPLHITGIVFLSTAFVSAIVSKQASMCMEVYASRASAELNAFVYRKILQISPSSFCQRASQGEIVNFVQVDSFQIYKVIVMCPDLIMCPIMIAAYIYLLFEFFSYAFLAGIGTMGVFFGINYHIFKGYRVVQKDRLKAKDQRMKHTTETFDNIKVLKLYNWENQFKRKIAEDWELELVQVRRSLNLSTTNISLFWLCPILVAIATIGVYQAVHDQFSIGTMLIGLAIFARLQEPVRTLPNSINSILELFVSMRRIEKFIRQPERDENNVVQGEYDEHGEYAIKIENGYFTWGERQKKADTDTDTANTASTKQEQQPSTSDTVSAQNVSVDKQQRSDDPLQVEIKASAQGSLCPPSESSDMSSVAESASRHNYVQIQVPSECEYDVVLKGISFQVQPGEIVGLIGEVGCGKSTLLQAILNSLILLNPKTCDGIHINGSIGYVPQTPWIQNASIRDNILFFKEYDEEKYEEVLQQSQLKVDLDNFDGGDNTEIGEKGINLSGGQKVRVSLARVLYQQPDIYLFDDPISALDANVGKRVMKDCIVEYLKGKTRIVATHALQYLKYMDRIFYIESGMIKWVGSYKELLEQKFFDDLKKMTVFTKNTGDDEHEGAKAEMKGDINIIASEGKDDDDVNNNNSDSDNKSKRKSVAKKEVKITREEDQEIGVVKMAVYIKYITYMGGACISVGILLVMIAWQGGKAGSDLWLAYWSEPENQQGGSSQKWIFFSIYSVLGVSSAVFIFLRIFLLSYGIIKLMRSLHTDMINKLVKAPINIFHETVPRGQIYNRLSKDLDGLQFSIYMIGNGLVGVLSVLGSVILCSLYDLYSLLFIPFLSLVGYFLTSYYLSGSRQLSRLEAVSRSPLLNTISETIPGINTIRAFDKAAFYKMKYFDQVNTCLKININSAGIYYWFSQQFDYLSLLFLTYLVLTTLLKENELSSQNVAIMFTYSVVLQKNLSYLFTSAARLETNMVGMERCTKYTEIPGERPSVIEETDAALIKQHWPSEGRIRFENYSVRYRPNTEVVLKNINFSVNANERIGVVGRTGSGKSTICLCLFRLLEPLTGTIYIDDQDISNIGLDLLRQNLTIIPQDPCLMAGSLKYNIDPLEMNSPEEILRTLREIGFEETDSEKESGQLLEREIEQNGANLSVGEKQLVCIARAILRKTKIIVMDEATASIDMKTEEKIQDIIHNTMTNCTIITIAHRIKTIIDYDRILVLDDGKVMEFDRPDALLADKNSLFYELYSKSGI